MDNLDLHQLNSWFDQALKRMSPAAVRKLEREIGDYLIRANRERITAQTAPDGQKWPERKPQTGGSNGKMMRRLRQRKHLKMRRSSGGLRVGWFGRVGRIARIHHYGLRDRLQYGIAEYPARELIGITAADVAAVEAIITRHLTGG